MKNTARFGFAVLLLGGCVATGVLSSVWMSRAQGPAVSLPTALATSDRMDGYITCTGFVDSENEAVFVLDSTTGLLSAAVVSRNPSTPRFQARYQTNVHQDLNDAVGVVGGGKAAKTTKKRSTRTRKDKEEKAPLAGIQIPQEPKYIMTAGSHAFQGANSTIRPATSILYVTEINTGIMLVYVLPWNPSAHASNNAFSPQLPCFFSERFVVPLVMEEAIEE